MGDREHPDYTRSEMVEMMREASSGDMFARGVLFGFAAGLLVAVVLTLIVRFGMPA